jgi:3-deoxy-7-phosphoheptulonate synthase
MDENILSLKEIISPNEILNKYNINSDDFLFIDKSRTIIKNILSSDDAKDAKDAKDARLLVIIGPCSIHNYDLALQYAEHIKKFQELYPNLFIVMRVYFEKPRSRHGWKGFIYDPDLNDTFDINKGLNLARKLCVELTKMRIPIGCEFLDTISPQYLADLVSWGAIGARTSESQIHRQLASGLSAPIGFKNLTDGDYKKAIDGILSAMYPHQFLGINYSGTACHVSTKGNKYAHLILRGGIEPNYYQKNIQEITEVLKKEKINTGIIIDCSHGNSQKEYMKQIYVAFSINRLLTSNNYPGIKGVMIESHINEGNQKLTSNLSDGISITDGCIDIKSSLYVLNILNNRNTKIKLTTLNEVREYLIQFEKPILYQNIEINENLIKTNIDSSELNIIINYDDDIFNIMKNNIKLMCLIYKRLSLSELIANIKFNDNPIIFLNKINDFYKLITDREIEKGILSRINELKTNDSEIELFIKIMELSKRIQVKYLEEYVKTKLIGFLGSSATFSYEVITNNFYGRHIGNNNLEDLYNKLDTNEIDYGLIPTYNSLIGVLYTIDVLKYCVLGSIDHKIVLSVYSNNSTINYNNVKTIYIQEMLYKEVIGYLTNKIKKDVTIEICKTTEESCIKCIIDKTSMTIASTNNKCNFLNLIEDNIVDHNITTFSLIKKNII